MQRFLRFAPRDLLRDVPLALLIGAGVGVVLWIGDSQRENWWVVPISAWVGLWLYATVIATLLLFSGLLARLRGWRLYALLTPLLFLASAAGFYLGLQTAPLLDPLWRLLLGESPPWLYFMFGSPSWLVMLAFAGALGLVLTLLFFRYEVLKSSLRQSIEKAKDGELAERELEMARKIQRRILGPATLEGPGYRIAARNRPALYVAGDFFDISPRSDGALGLVAADVSGKGMAASLVMASVKGRLPLLAESASVVETLVSLNRSLIQELSRREFVALCYVRYRPASGEFELANAGLPDPYVLTDGKSPQALSVPGPRLPLGLRRQVRYESLSGRLEVGQRLLLLTDGMPEATLPDGDPLGYPELERMLEPSGDSPEAWLDELFERLDDRVGATLEDDWTALLLQRSTPSEGVLAE